LRRWSCIRPILVSSDWQLRAGVWKGRTKANMRVADFFDGKHNIVLGGSWATHPRIAGRKSL
jgi:hypothetical protein